MFTRRDALRGGTASVAAIVVGGAATAATAREIHKGAVLARSAREYGVFIMPAADNSLCAIADEMTRLEKARDDIDCRLGAVDGNADPTVDEAGREALKKSQAAYLDQWRELGAQLREARAYTHRGILAKFRGWYGEDEQARMSAGEEPWDGLPENYAASIYRDLLRMDREARS